MPLHRSLIAVLLLFTTSVFAKEPPIPGRAEQAFNRWLAAYNAGSHDELQAFISNYSAGGSAQRYLEIKDDFGHFKVLEVRLRTPDKVEVILASEVNDSSLLATVIINPDDPGKVDTLQLEGVETPDAYKPPRMPMSVLLAEGRARLDSLVAADQLSGAFLLAKQGEILMQWQGGPADRAQSLPVTATTKFRLASLNKMFTAIAVLQLAEAGKLSLDDTIGTHLKNYPNPTVADAVSVRQLLNHTSGLGDIFGEKFQAHAQTLKTLEDYVPLFGADPPESAAGSEDGYSNYGYILLGLIIEAVSGQSYYDYVEQHIHRRAGMEATASEPESTPVAGRAIAYSKVDGRWRQETKTLPWRGTSAGGGYSTVGDLLKFAEALRTGKLLSEKGVQAATTAQNHKGWYGYGFMVGGQDRQRRYGHEGGAPGANAALFVLPGNAYVVIGLSNVDPAAMEHVVHFVVNRLPL